METNNNFTREDISESLHNEFGLTKKDCIIFVARSYNIDEDLEKVDLDVIQKPNKM